MTVHIGANPATSPKPCFCPATPTAPAGPPRPSSKDPVLVNEVRGMLGYTGTWNGHRVTIHGSGMGMPSLSIYANELIRDYGAKTLIRIGSAGALAQPRQGPRRDPRPDLPPPLARPPGRSSKS
jgi:purine-nucleoside phosphorylase